MQRHHHLLLVLAAADALLGLTPSNSPRARAADRLDSAATSLETFKPSEVFQGGFHAVSYTHLTLPTICSV